MKEFAEVIWTMDAGTFVVLAGGLLFGLLLWATALAVVLGGRK